ncbi:MAG: hypothetical protein GY757_35210 [bacterium]|nr:hypothetical protein [bacterium]
MSKERKKLVIKLDKEFSLFIRERDGYKCVVCGHTPPAVVMQCGHLFSRVSNSTRWDELNAHAQCSGCNLLHEHNPEPYRRRWVELHGQDAYDTLYAKWNQATKFTLTDLALMAQMFREKRKKLEAAA